MTIQKKIKESLYKKKIINQRHSYLLRVFFGIPIITAIISQFDQEIAKDKFEILGAFAVIVVILGVVSSLVPVYIDEIRKDLYDQLTKNQAELKSLQEGIEKTYKIIPDTEGKKIELLEKKIITIQLELESLGE
ncbi:MAG: hypothetical protein WC872_03305 [Candidatus Absconditabacterales bacterium]|jgi:uncharacterized membrane protein (DUF106 family)